MKNKIFWGLQILAAAAFIAAGGAKLAGVPQMVETFDKLGIGQWFRIATGLCEVIGGLLLLTPHFSGFGAALLACVMAGATITHLFIIGGNPFPAIVLFSISSFLAFQRFPVQFRALKAA